MALKQTIRLTLYERSPYKIKGRDGKTYEGIIYEGFTADNRTFRFTSKNEKYPVYDTGRYKEENSRDFDLYGRTKIDGGTKWQDEPVEKKSLDKDFSQEPDF